MTGSAGTDVSIGIMNIDKMYASPSGKNPVTKRAAKNRTRKTVTSITKYSAKPAITPAIIAFWGFRLSVFIGAQYSKSAIYIV